jgi:hypothetical protein
LACASFFTANSPGAWLIIWVWPCFELLLAWHLVVGLIKKKLFQEQFFGFSLIEVLLL